MNQGMLKGGLVGCGDVANGSHMPAWRAQKHAEIVAVCDPREEAAVETGRRWGISSIHRDFSQMLQTEELDFVDICSPPATHCQLSTQAMKARLHVLVEKPMANSLGEAEEMVAAAGEYGVKLCVAHNFLFTPVVQAAKALVASGAIGELVALHAAITTSRERLGRQDHWYHSLPGGILHEYAPHPVYLASAFLGDIRSVRAIACKYSDFTWVPADELMVLVEGGNRLGALRVSCNPLRFSLALDLFGTKGSLHLDNLTQAVTRMRSRPNRADRLVLDRLALALQSVTVAARLSARTVLRQKWYQSGHRALIQKFVSSILNDLPPPVTGEDGRKTTRILEEIWRQIGQAEKPAWVEAADG